MITKLLAQGAESKLYVKGDLLIKKRIKKSYRINELDLKLRKHRTKGEARMLRRAGKLINVPKVSEVKEYEILMDYINAPVLRDVLSNNLEVMKELGRVIGTLHASNIIHGDLTTSNMLLHKNEVFMIDFGLSEVKDSIEAKAVDLHVLKQALQSKHYNEYKKAWKLVKDSYIKTYKKGEKVLERLKTVESRGRYKNKHCV